MGREHALLLALTLAACDRAPAKEPAAATAPTAPTKIVVPTEGAPIVTPPPPSDPEPTATTDTGAPTIGSATAAPDAPASGAAPTTAGAPTVGATATDSSKPGERAVPSRKGARIPAASPNAPTPSQPATTGAPATTSPAAPTTPPPNVPPPTSPTPAAPPATPVATKILASEKLFRIELAPPAPCKPATPCVATLVVHSLDGYKVNAEYPTKFVAKSAPGITVEGTGSFAVSAKTVGAMTVTFRAAQAGTARLAGAFKLSVCTDEICEIAAPAIAFDIPVTAP